MDVNETPSSSSAKRSPNVKPSVSDENDQSLHLRQLGFGNMKKLSPKKNLPTDGASKVTSPKNQVLTERNGSDHPIGNIPISHSEPVKASPSTSGSKISPSSSADRFGKEFLLPHEPFTNYLSPRPRFLRYKPDRQREMALHLEKEAGKGKEVSSSSGSPNETENVNGEGAGSVSSFDILKPEGEEDPGDSDDEVEEEEEEEQRSSICQELLKTLLLLVMLVFPASSYRSDMHSTPSISCEVGVSEDGYWSIKNYTYEADLYGRALGLGCGSNLINQARETENDFGFLVKNVARIDELEEREEVVEVGLGAIKITNDDRNEERLAVVNVGEEAKLNLGESYHIDQGIVKPDEVSDQLTEGFELQQGENAVNLDCEMPNALDMEAKPPLEPETRTSVQSEVEKEWGGTDEGSGVNFPIEKPEAKLNNEVLIVRIGTESGYNAIIGLLTVSLALSAAFLFGLFLKGKKNPANHVCSSPLKKQLCPGPVAEKKHERQFQMREQNCTEPLVPNSITDPSPIHALEEASAQSNQSRAPKIELLGEFVVGELSSLHRRSEMKSKMIGRVEESTNSVSTDKSGIKVNVTQPAFSEFSSMNSPSHGSFTADRNIKKPQEDGTGESSTAVVTPARRSSRTQNTSVRRSSRIRNLAIQSP